MNISEIEKEGFYIQETKSNTGNLALLSLRSSLKAYFATYQTMHFSLSNILNNKSKVNNFDSHTLKYCENACSAITNFQHFAELILKDILRKKHILLSVNPQEKTILLDDLLEGKQIDNDEIDSLKQIEFSTALKRILDLLTSHRLDKKFGFIKSFQPFLVSLNTLRNRILHRGVFVLSYAALDHFFSRFAFPFLENVINLEEYEYFQIWKSNRLSSGINVIDEISKCAEAKKYPIYKLALLKELGRASYQNPLDQRTIPIKKKTFGFDAHTIRRSQLLAKQIDQAEFGHGIKICPVCGVNSLVLFTDSIDEIGNNNEIIGMFDIVYKVQCFCCTFEIYHEIIDIDKMELPIENYWI